MWFKNIRLSKLQPIVIDKQLKISLEFYRIQEFASLLSLSIIQYKYIKIRVLYYLWQHGKSLHQQLATCS